MNQLGNEIIKVLDGRSQYWLARESGVGQSTISRLVRGKGKPTPETLEALARALGIDPSVFMELAGIPQRLISNDVDPSVAYIARRMSDLPEIYRELAIDAVGAQLDVIYTLAENHAQTIKALEDKLEEKASFITTSE